MAVVYLKPSNPDLRWELTLRRPQTLDEDLGFIGETVGPRTGPDKRTKGQKEDYVLRRLLAAWRIVGEFRFPATARAHSDAAHQPDFLFSWAAYDSLGLEVTEAGEENYQAWLTATEADREAGGKRIHEVPLEASTPRTAAEIKRAIARKIANFDDGSYREASACDLVVYDNTAWGGFLDKREVIEAVGRPNDLMGRFRQVHIVFESVVCLDLFGARRLINIRNAYEADFTGWLFDQADRLEHGRMQEVDAEHMAEELRDLGNEKRSAVASHLRNLLFHLLKWQHQQTHRTESWRLSIDNARSELYERLTKSPSLRPFFADVFQREYLRARRTAAAETGIPLATFPETCPYRPDEVLDPEYLPEQ